MNECRICNGQLKEQRVTRLQDYNGRWYILENVLALVCERCGEIYYTPESHDHIIDLISSDVTPVRIEQVAVLDAS